jgi:catechol 2,3-dioxygenase-like lactoylglutathione lyase family enzyme
MFAHQTLFAASVKENLKAGTGTSIIPPMTRREALRILPALLVAPQLSAQAGPDLAALDHIEFYVSDVEKSRDFFLRVFGGELRLRSGKRYLRLGSSYMAFEGPRGRAPAGSVDHFSAAIRKLEMPALHAYLEQRGVTYQDYPSGRDTGITDADGIRTQLSPENGWGLLDPSRFLPEATAIQDEPVFRAIALDHVLLNVAKLETSVAFYQKFLGRPTSANNRMWFQIGPSRVGLTQTPAGTPPGVNRFCVSAVPFDPAATGRKLQQLGAKAEPAETAGATEFRDPDGLTIQVIGTR